MALTALCLGSNLGDKKKNLLRAVELLEKEFDCLTVSPVYETLPFYRTGEEQMNFYNCCVKFETELTPHEIFNITSGIEEKMGRRRSYPHAPREIDIDLIFAGDSIVADEILTIPHTGMQDRKFVLKPLSDIMGGFEHPVIGIAVSDLYYECDDENEPVKVGELRS